MSTRQICWIPTVCPKPVLPLCCSLQDCDGCPTIKEKMNETHHIQLLLQFLAQQYQLHSKLQQENSCRVLNKGYISVPCRKTTQVLLNESRVCQHILFPILNVNSRSCFQCISETEETFLYLHIHKI